MSNVPPTTDEGSLDIEQVRSRYFELRDAESYDQATHYFAIMMEQAYERLTRGGHLDLRVPSIITSFAAKSGGTFLFNRQIESGGKAYFWGFPSKHCHSYVYPEQEALQRYLRGGCVCHTHTRPTALVMETLQQAGVEKLWVHLRNPAECVVSSYHHHIGEGQGEGALGDERRAEALRRAELMPVKPQNRDAFIASTIGWHCDWAKQWLDYAAMHPGKVIFTFYDELSNTPALLKRVYREFGSELKHEVSGQIKGHDRYRTKTSSDWRVGLADSTIEHVEQVVQEKLKGDPLYERLCQKQVKQARRKHWLGPWFARRAA